MQRLSPGQRWVVGLGVFAIVLLVVGLVAVITTVHASGWCLVASNGSEQTWEGCQTDDSGIVWGGVLAVIGLLHLGLTGLAGALVWTATPSIGPAAAGTTTDGRRRTRVQVFAVGDLRSRSTQNRVLGRTFRGVEDTLPGWREEDGTVRPGEPDDDVAGAVLSLEDWQLTALERHLGPTFHRVEAGTASGARVWIFTPVV